MNPPSRLNELLRTCRAAKSAFRDWSPRRRGALVLAGGAALAGLAFGLPESDGGKTEDAFAGTILPVSLLTLQHDRYYEVEERHAGVVEARRKSVLGFARGGLLTKIEVNEGDRVVEGQPLARLDTRGLQARADELRSMLAESRNRVDAASADRDLTASQQNRSAALAKNDWVSKKVRDENIFEHRKAVAERAAAVSVAQQVQASLAGVQVELEQSVLVAPYAGTIIARRIDEGGGVSAGEPVLDLIESDVVEFKVGVPEKTAATLKEGEEYSAVIGDRKTTAVLLRLLPNVDGATRTVGAVFSLPKMQPPPISGSLAHLLTRDAVPIPGFRLPLSALTDSRRGLWAVYVFEPDGGAERQPGSPPVGVLSRRDVQLIHVDGDQAFVSGILRDGEQVVADGAHRLMPGLRVQAAAAR